MKINIEKINTGPAVYEIPKEYLVVNVFQSSPMEKNFFILGKNLKQNDWYGIFYFDGISELPTSYQTFWSNPDLLKESR